MEVVQLNNISIDHISLPITGEKKLQVDVLRLDKIHEYISGNKWFKLRFYLEAAKKNNNTTIVTYGGAWSNHLLATAAAAQLQGLESIGIVRGEEPAKPSAVLELCKAMDMELIFISRDDFRNKRFPEFRDDNFYIVPEGGYSKEGMQGAATIHNYFPQKKFTHILCAVGTGTMAAGLLHMAEPGCQVTAISVLKNNFELEKNIKSLAGGFQARLDVIHEYSFGGYAHYNEELIKFMNSFYRKAAVTTDFVYTGKLFFAASDLVARNYFPPDSQLLIIHSGGLKGNLSLDKGTLIF